MHKPGTHCNKLLGSTAKALDPTTLEQLYRSVQLNNLEVYVELAIKKWDLEICWYCTNLMGIPVLSSLMCRVRAVPHMLTNLKPFQWLCKQMCFLKSNRNPYSKTWWLVFPILWCVFSTSLLTAFYFMSCVASRWYPILYMWICLLNFIVSIDRKFIFLSFVDFLSYNLLCLAHIQCMNVWNSIWFIIKLTLIIIGCEF
jgi:hypothetical protein